MATFDLNGEAFEFDGADNTPLLWVLREAAGLQGTKFGCGAGHCGACAVHVDGRARRACVTPVGAIAGRKITTIEGLGGDELHPVQQAWLEEDVVQCGYCQAGQIMTAADWLQRVPDPSDEDIEKYQANLCRCGTYARVRKAIKRAAEISRNGAVAFVEPVAGEVQS
ncbi:MAG: (2Fe-2S)-binding protein [Halieaceae bacterium]|jgi:isoquinoline 1-oxidoreductase alpha subunit|nr:(2Fe-2S)-binding protein [Halieaceae bacterium]